MKQNKEIKEIYDIFYLFKNRNIQEKEIVETLSAATKFASNITDLKKYNKNLLVFSCINDNENLFNFLTDNFKSEFILSYRECILINYINKNPNILRKSFESLPTQTEEELEEFINRFGTNCYRQENIHVVSEWLLKNTNSSQKTKFIETLIEKNNKPFLNIIIHNPLWNKIIYSHQPKNSYEEQLVEYLKRIKIDPKESINQIITSTDVLKDIEPTNNIITRKKRIPVSVAKQV